MAWGIMRIYDLWLTSHDKQQQTTGWQYDNIKKIHIWIEAMTNSGFLSFFLSVLCVFVTVCSLLHISHLHLWPPGPYVEKKGWGSTSCLGGQTCCRTPIVSAVTAAANNSSPAGWAPARRKGKQSSVKPRLYFCFVVLWYNSSLGRNRIRCECDCPLWESSCLFHSQFQFTVRWWSCSLTVRNKIYLKNRKSFKR